ncbi:hypothetical protein, partial [Bradyrhizobium sp. CCBAU 51627]|uniref:hypothetical protein n=1 Tax=Bradyrhizobium sp. CCBAU 51627 TaxID=1325088 RepID=UPI0023068822
GRQGTDATSAASGDIVFTLSVVTSGAGAGDVTLTQLRAIHENTGDTGTSPGVADSNEAITLDNYVSNLVQLTATI